MCLNRSFRITNVYIFLNQLKSYLFSIPILKGIDSKFLKESFAQSAGAVEYTDCISAEG